MGQKTAGHKRNSFNGLGKIAGLDWRKQKAQGKGLGKMACKRQQSASPAPKPETGKGLRAGSPRRVSRVDEMRTLALLRMIAHMKEKRVCVSWLRLIVCLPQTYCSACCCLTLPLDRNKPSQGSEELPLRCACHYVVLYVHGEGEEGGNAEKASATAR